MRWSDALGREVVDTSTAVAVGRIDALVVDARASSIAGFVIGDQVVSWSATGGIGSDALTISGTDTLHFPGSATEQGAVDGRTRPLDKPVLTEDGYGLGDLANIEFDPATGAIEQLILPDDHLAGSRLLGVGSFAVVVSSADRSSSNGDLGGLTKAELYDRAKDCDIDGRSTMSKDELLAALG